MRATIALATLVLLLGTSATASPIQLVADFRELEVPDDLDPYVPPAPFAPWDIGVHLIDNSFFAIQDSSFSPSGFQGSGAVWLANDYTYPVNADPVAVSRAGFTFTLSEAATVRIQGELAIILDTSPEERSWAFAELGGGGLGDIWFESIGDPDDPPGLLRTFDETFTLPAGSYSFTVQATVWGEQPGPGARWNVVLSVPEPVLWPLLAVLLPFARRRIASA